MSGDVLVSVVIPCFNYAQYMRETIDSALAQSYKDIEIIILDDGSTDNTKAVAAEYGDQVEYHYQENKGLPAARNAGFRKAHGTYVLFIDADDKLDPQYVAKTLEVALAHPEAAFVYTQQRYFEASDEVTTFPAYDRRLLKEKNYIPACSLIRADILRRFSYDSRYVSWEDWDFYLTLAKAGLCGVLVDEPLILYRKHADQQSMLDTFGQRKKVRTLAQIRYKHWRLYGVLETLRFTAWYAQNR
jgi:glycosyltransferase involved in cell wall biosynthesis